MKKDTFIVKWMKHMSSQNLILEKAEWEIQEVKEADLQDGA